MEKVFILNDSDVVIKEKDLTNFINFFNSQSKYGEVTEEDFFEASYFYSLEDFKKDSCEDNKIREKFLEVEDLINTYNQCVDRLEDLDYYPERITLDFMISEKK